MGRLSSFLDDKLAKGQAFLTRDEVQQHLGVGIEAATAAAARLIRKGRLASPRNGFYLIVRPEDRAVGAADPAQWIGPLMEFQGLDYRISLLRAAAWHGSSPQAAMVFQVVAPRQLRDLELGRHRLEFFYQAQSLFEEVNRDPFVVGMSTPAGYAKVAGVELTLLDCLRYLNASGGLGMVAQIVKDLGAKTDPVVLEKLAPVYEGATTRRLGYLLDLFGHRRRAQALELAAARAKSYVPLDPTSHPVLAALAEEAGNSTRWKLMLNEPVEVDA